MNPASRNCANPAVELRPVRAGRFLAPKVPKPRIRTFSPFAKASLIASNTPSTVSYATAVFGSSRTATRSSMSDLYSHFLFDFVEGSSSST